MIIKSKELIKKLLSISNSFGYIFLHESKFFLIINSKTTYVRLIFMNRVYADHLPIIATLLYGLIHFSR